MGFSEFSENLPFVLDIAVRHLHHDKKQTMVLELFRKFYLTIRASLPLTGQRPLVPRLARL